MKLYKVFLNISLEADEKSLSYIGLFTMSILALSSPYIPTILRNLQFSNIAFYIWLAFNLMLQLYFLRAAYQMGVRFRWAEETTKSAKVPFLFAAIIFSEFMLIFSCINKMY